MAARRLIYDKIVPLLIVLDHRVDDTHIKHILLWITFSITKSICRNKYQDVPCGRARYLWSRIRAVGAHR
jgi:hypothetical protein